MATRICSYLLLVALIVGAGCATLPRTIDEDTLEQDIEARAEQWQGDTGRIISTMANRMAAKAASLGDPVATVDIDILVLSGGGEYGAFGAGFLNGWGARNDGILPRPDFDIVTGISTGALIAPFAFLGDETSYATVLNLYKEATPEFAVLRGLFFFLPRNPAFLDNSGLVNTVRETVDESLLQRVSEAYAENRLLFIGTTDIDVGQFVVWDLGHETVAHPDPEERFEQILLASSAIPAAFPPVFIDNHLHVDGGATEQMFIATDYRIMEAAVNEARQCGLQDHPVNFRFWIVVNGQLALDAEVVPPSWFKIAQRSLTMLMKASSLSALQRGQQMTEILNARQNDITGEFRYVCIPQNFDLPQSRNLFNPDLMQRLTELGFEMGADPSVWRTEAPRFGRGVLVE
ncbi:MAG: patatin-like phospholipase family protein [Candidatus Hydrogenedentes bacterium]|nr:patatin-like phospholipase family protein [Candidatus Hydrogenedentota bacterium]